MKKSDFFRFENKNDDFPFYNGNPMNFTALQSWFLLIVSIGSVVFFEVGASFLPKFMHPFINIIIPLGAFAIVVKSNWTKIFRKIYFKDILLVFGVLIVNLIVSIISGLILTKFAGAAANPAVGSLNGNSTFENIIFMAKLIPMLFGEELITIIPFLVILQFGTKTLKLSRKQAVTMAWILSAIIFGAVHLKTYNWNIIQAVIGIGMARLVLTFPYIKTKNIWISTFVHVLNDWCLFLPGLFF
ncbi:hypothetical protein TPDSL_34780 [Terrisporobacter petrolearius]|uniref:CPBP family intramembrane glutamic endopeptidase n=1 Tax=Terrisporobacter petrolearius TaxID=1460447 RepID=UPI003366DD5C